MNPALVPIIVAVTLPLVLRAIAKLVPYRKGAMAAADDVPLEELKRRYQKWELFSLLPLFVFVALFAGLIALALNWWYDRTLPPAGSRDLLYCIPAPFWYLIGLFLGIASAALPMHLTFAFLLKDRYAEFIDYGNRKVGFDSYRVFNGIAVCIVAISVVAIALCMDCYWLVTSKGLTSNDFFSFGTEIHPYSGLKELRRIAKYRAPSGNVIDKPYVELAFGDGYTWSSGTHSIRGTNNADTSARLLRFVSESSGQPIVPYEFTPD